MNSLIEIAVAEIKQLAVVEPKQASKKFELMANTMSDAQLVEVIENIDIVTLTQINSQHDISFPSIISELMTAEKIRDIVCQQPLYWEEKIKNNADELKQHTFDFLTYLCHVILSALYGSIPAGRRLLVFLSVSALWYISASFIATFWCF